MTIPPPLHAGENIGIVSTARKILESDIRTAIDVMEKWGFKVVIGDSIGVSIFNLRERMN